MPGESRIVVVSVSYNSAAILPGMLASVPKETRVVIVDNGGRDAEELQALQRKHGFDLITSDRNLGFGTACNLGARDAPEELILFLNPDARLCDGALAALRDAARAYSNAVAFNPLIVKEDGSYLLRGRCKILPREVMAEAAQLPFDRDVDLPILSGAALLVRRDAFDAVGGFDDRIFLYFEDDDLSVRLRQAGGRLMRIASARVNHAGGTSSGASEGIQRLKNHEWARARVYVTRKHGVRYPRMSAILEGVRALRNPIRDGERQSLRARAGLLTGAISTFWDGGARVG